MIAINLGQAVASGNCMLMLMNPSIRTMYTVHVLRQLTGNHCCIDLQGRLQGR